MRCNAAGRQEVGAAAGIRPWAVRPARQTVAAAQGVAVESRFARLQIAPAGADSTAVLSVCARASGGPRGWSPEVQVGQVRSGGAISTYQSPLERRDHVLSRTTLRTVSSGMPPEKK